MFTGIVEATAKVISNNSGKLIVERPGMFDDIKLGSSIAVSGVCLSVVEFDTSMMRFDVVTETLAKTKLGSVKEGSMVNLERAMKASDRFEGHIVQGHVEGKGVVETAGERLKIRIQKEIKDYVIHKGSITIDGVSLTVASLADEALEIALIPHTLSSTTLGNLKKGDEVNIETDILGKYILQKSSRS